MKIIYFWKDVEKVLVRSPPKYITMSDNEDTVNETTRTVRVRKAVEKFTVKHEKR